MTQWLEPTILTGDLVRLVPMTTNHRAGILDAVKDGELWNLWFTSVPSEETIDQYMQYAFDEQAHGRSLPFVVMHNDRIIGATRYCNAEPAHRRLEIGYTWYSRSMQRTGVNTECKLLLLTFAFETLDAIAVEFRTSWFNHRSRNAILRLGAKQDGVLRNHRIDQSGLIRDTVVFSIIANEWAMVKHSLTFEKNKHA